MPEKELTSVQRYVLLTLLINAEPLPNPAVSNSLKATARDDLKNRWRYIEVSDSRPMVLELTQDGHDRAIAALSEKLPAGSGAPGLALSAALGFIRELGERTKTKPQNLFRFRLSESAGVVAREIADAEDLAVPEDVVDLEEGIRKAYSSLAARPGDYVMLEELREALSGVERERLDEALIRINGSRHVNLIPESNQKVLTEGQRAAAVRIGNQLRHLIAISS